MDWERKGDSLSFSLILSLSLPLYLSLVLSLKSLFQSLHQCSNAAPFYFHFIFLLKSPCLFNIFLFLFFKHIWLYLFHYIVMCCFVEFEACTLLQKIKRILFVCIQYLIFLIVRSLTPDMHCCVIVTLKASQDVPGFDAECPQPSL